MTISPTSPVLGNGIAARETSMTSPTVETDKQTDLFMKMLLTQLRNQDPMNPLKDSEFMSQISQLQMAEKISQLKDTMVSAARTQVLAQAATLIGREVQAQSAQGPISGAVTGVRMIDEDVILDVGHEAVRLGDVKAIRQNQEER